jgi:hypothetical protein
MKIEHESTISRADEHIVPKRFDPSFPERKFLSLKDLFYPERVLPAEQIQGSIAPPPLQDGE